VGGIWCPILGGAGPPAIGHGRGPQSRDMGQRGSVVISERRIECELMTGVWVSHAADVTNPAKMLKVDVSLKYFKKQHLVKQNK